MPVRTFSQVSYDDILYFDSFFCKVSHTPLAMGVDRYVCRREREGGRERERESTHIV